MKRLGTFELLIVAMLALSPWMIGAYISWTAGSFEVSPPNTESLNLTDDRIRELKENIRNRMQVEHYFGTGVGASDNGRHREGSASAWFASPCPTNNVTGDPSGGSTAYTAADEGKLCSNSTDLSMQIYNGSAYVGAFGTFFNNSLGRYSAGVAPVDTFDPTKFHIRSITADTTVDAVACAAYSTTALASQVFGDAGAACFSITVNLAARSTFTPTTSRGIIIANGAGLFSAGGGVLQMAVYRDAIANQVGFTAGVSSGGNQVHSTTMIAYVTGLSAASHEFALHFLDTGSGTIAPAGADPLNGNLIYVDLGPEY